MKPRPADTVDGGQGRARRWPNTPFYYGWVIVGVGAVGGKEMGPKCLVQGVDDLGQG